MTYDQAVQVVKLAMRRGVCVSVSPIHEEPSEFGVAVLFSHGPRGFDLFTAALDAIDAAAVSLA